MRASSRLRELFHRHRNSLLVVALVLAVLVAVLTQHHVPSHPWLPGPFPSSPSSLFEL